MELNGKRQRVDGSWTFSTEEWDAAWYRPVGTRVSVRGAAGTVVKENSVTVRVAFDGDDARTGLVSKTLLTRIPPTSGATMQALADATTAEGLRALRRLYRLRRGRRGRRGPVRDVRGRV